MRSWTYHYDRAEALLNKTLDPHVLVNAKQTMLAQAQVHATLATIKYGKATD